LTSFRVIKESFDFLNKLPVFQILRKLIRILSVISLILNLIIFSIFSQINPILFISSIPGINQIGTFVYENSSENTQNFISWLILKIKTFLLWCWSTMLNFIKTIIKAVIGDIEKSIPYDPQEPSI
jgi:hypothetical protein